MARSKTNLTWLTAALISTLAGGTAFARQAVLDAVPQKTVPANTLPPAQDGDPRMVFEELNHDYGRIPDTEHIVHEFKFKNEGTGTLVIQQPTASCGCTVPFLTKREYAPGESGVIQVTYNPHGRRGDQTQRITINTNDQSNPQIVLTIKAFVRTTIAFEPQSINFGDVMVGHTAKQVVRVQGPAPDFEVSYASTNKGRYVTVRVLETRKANLGGEEINETLLEYTFNGRASRGAFAAMSTVRTTSDKNPLADLYITAEVVGDLQVLPPRVNVGIVNTGDGFHRMFRVSSRTGKPFKILNVDHIANLPNPLQIEWKPAQVGNETVWQVEIRGNAPETMAPISANLTIMTDQPQDEMVTVQVSGAVRPPQPAMPSDAEVQEQPHIP
jgi:hypothetical protein